MGAAAGVLSGESETECMVDTEDGALLWEWLDEAALRRDVERLLRNCRPISPTVLEILCRDGCLRFCGVVGTPACESYWPAIGGVTSGGGGAVGLYSGIDDVGGRLRVGGMLEREALCLLFPPKNDGRLLNTLPLDDGGGCSMVHSTPKAVGTPSGAHELVSQVRGGSVSGRA